MGIAIVNAYGYGYDYGKGLVGFSSLVLGH